MTASEAAAPLFRLPRSSSEPRCTSAPAASSDWAPASERAMPRTSCPPAISSLTAPPGTHGLSKVAAVRLQPRSWTALLPLMLTDVEREHLFLLGLGRPPEARYRAVEGITPRLQRILDVLEVSPALIRTATWDVVAWNRAASAVFGDYNKLEPLQRNILRLTFSNSRFRSCTTRLGKRCAICRRSIQSRDGSRRATENVMALVDELSRISPEFARMWKENEVRTHGGGKKQLATPPRALSPWNTLLLPLMADPTSLS